MKINTPVEPKIETADQQEQAPETARDTIRAAMNEVKEKSLEEQKTQEEKKDASSAPKAGEGEPGKELSAPGKDKQEIKPAEEKSDEKKSDEDKAAKKVEEVKEEVKGAKEPKEGEPKEPKPSKAAPFGLPKNIRAKWENTDPEVQEYLAKTVKENLDTKANQGRKSYLNEVDQVLTPYMPQLQQLGATPAQLVHRLLQYSDALSNEQYKYHAIAKLAQDFNIDLALFGKKQTDDQNQDDKSQQVDDNYQDYIPPELNTKLDMILNKFSQMETSHRTDNDKAAEKTVHEWAGFDPATQEYKNKPFFPYVRQMMSQLIANQTVPLVDGKIDLDATYEAACYAHPEIREYMIEEQTRAIEAKRLEEQKQQAAAIERAKNAGTSIKPAAPAPRLPSQHAPKINAKGQQLSVRESLRHAIAEARDTRI